MLLLESLEGRKRTPWMLQLVFNKILTFPIDQFRVEKHGCGGSRKEGWGRAPLPLLYQPSMLHFLLQHEHTAL